MKTPLFTSAVTETTVADLTAFLKENDQYEILGWKEKKAGEKRAAFLDALTASMNMRKDFVAFYSKISAKDGVSSDWTDWEADLQEGDIEETQIVSEAPTLSTPVAGPLAGTFVEGNFEQMKSDVAGLDAENSTTALKAAEEDLELNHMRIGVVLHHISAKQHYATLGYDNMRQYIESETALGYRKAMYLIANTEKVNELGISSAELKGVTWAALRHVLPVMDKSNYKKWLDAARGLTHVKLIAAVEDEKVKKAGNALPKPSEGDETTPAQEPVKKTFNLYPDQAEQIAQAIEKAKVEGNTDSTGAALNVMAASYIGKPVVQSSMAAVMPDLSDDGLKKIFSKIFADEGDMGLVRIMEALDPFWGDRAEISVVFPGEEVTAAE